MNAGKGKVLTGKEITTSRQKGRPKLQEGAEIDQIIGEAAIKTLLEHGEAATLNAVAKAAGLTRKSLYARYANKNDLFLAVIRGLLEMAQGIDYAKEGSAKEQLNHYIQSALNHITTPQSRIIQQLLARDSNYLSALRKDMFDATYRHFYRPLHTLLKDANTRGEFSIVDLDATVKFIIKLIFAESFARDDSESFWENTPAPATNAQFMTQMLMDGLLPRAHE